MKMILFLMTAAMTLLACNERQNPFLSEWDTPYGIPAFADIQTDDYIPAIQAGIEQQNKEIEDIVNNSEEPTFENTIQPLELSGNILSRVAGVLYNIHETDRTPEIDSVMELAIPLFTEQQNNISFNKALYERIAKLYKADQSQLTREQQMVLKKRFEEFERNGIGLPEDKQARLREINTEMASKTQKLGNNILSENNAFKEKFGTPVSSYTSEMTSCEDRARREEMFKAYSSRGNNGNEYDNKSIALEILKLRAE
jgi:peptidyl-dipeptidase Dcp